MKKLIPLMILTAFIIMVPAAYAEPNLSMELTPEPIYNQLWAYETYLINVTINDFNLSEIDLSEFSSDPAEFRVVGNIYWKGIGGYDFGTATTGYSYNLDEMQVELESAIEEHSVSFNLTLSNDALDLGMKPYETVQIIIKLDTYLIINDGTGPKIASNSHIFELVDETKIEYLDGKYLEMKEEINGATNATSLNSLNRERYQGILESMNASLATGNYAKALDIWDDYNEDDRADLITGIIKASEEEYTELEELRTVETQLENAQRELNELQNEYELLENTYVALANTYSKVNSQLDVAKRNLTTAITGVFLTAIVFYFLGRRGAKKEADVVA